MCHNLGTRQRTKTHGIDFDCRVPVEAHGKPNGQANGSPGPPVCRVPNVRHTANKPGCRVFVMAHGKLPPFAVCFIFAVRFFPGTRQTYFLSCAFCLPCVFLLAHGKWTGCRVPEILHTTKIGAHGEVLDSGSVRKTTGINVISASPSLE